MIFAFLIIAVFAAIVSFGMFGSLPNPAVPKAQVYAQNMAIWHQAAMLQAAYDFSLPSDPIRTAIPTANCSPCVWPLTNELLGNVPTDPSMLKANWPEHYQSMVPETADITTRPPIITGWQSFLIRQINGTDTTHTGTEDYVLTVFLGFGNFGKGCPTNTIQSESFGNGGADSFGLGLAKTVMDRAGIGFLNCYMGASGAVCQFNRYAANAAGQAAEIPLQFDPDAAFYTSTGIVYLNFRQLKGCAAMMTRVSGN